MDFKNNYTVNIYSLCVRMFHVTVYVHTLYMYN